MPVGTESLRAGALFYRTTAIAVIALSSCTSDASGPIDLETIRPISVDMPLVSMSPGESRQVVVHASENGPSVMLSAEGLPAGLVASFSPATIAPGVTQSVMMLTATQSPLDATLTVRASSIDGAGTARTQGTATFQVSVRGCPGYAVPNDCPPFPTGGGLSINGLVREKTVAGVNPLGGVAVWAWVQRPTNGYQRGSVRSAADGTFSITTLPASAVTLQAYSSEWDQPCASIIELNGEGQRADVDLVSTERPIFDPFPDRPAITGVVYELTAAGRKPVAGARIWFETLIEVGVATTTTDEQGRYSLCRLPTSSSLLTPYKPGYAGMYKVVSVAGLMEIDLEIVKH